MYSRLSCRSDIIPCTQANVSAMFLRELLLIVSFHQVCDCARILFIIPTPSYSHQIVFRPLWKELATKGHDVVVATADPEDDESSDLREIDINHVYKHNRYMVTGFRDFAGTPGLGGFVREYRTTISETVLQTAEITALLRNETEHFDLLLTEVWYTVIFSFGDRFSCPVIGLVTLELNNDFYHMYGNPIHPIAYPDMFSGIDPNGMGFMDRLRSTFFVALYRLYSSMQFEAIDKETRLLKKYFGNDAKTVYELDRKLSMIFVNSVPSLSHRPLGLNTIYIGGDLHLNKPKPLPNDMAEFLDGAKNGAIYVSLGTNVKGEFITKNVREAFIGAFAELPYKVLWKFDLKLANVPKNVKIVDWMPQQDVLRHPNVKAFVFQGGLQSLEEAIANKIPLVGIPFISDQDANVKKLVKNGYGIGLDRDTITKESLKEAIFAVAENPKYKEAISKMAETIADQPMTGLEKAVWWTEYVIRHKGAPHLRNPIMDLPFYQYYLLDVLTFCLFVTIISLYVIYKLLSRFRIVLCKRLASEKKAKQKVK